MASAPVTARRQVRLAAIKAFAVLRSTNILKLLASPGVLPSQSETMPALLVRMSETGKETITGSTPDFTSTVTLEMESRLVAGTGEAVQDAIEELDAQVERALLTDADFVRMTQRVSISTHTEITSEARDFVAWTKWTVRCELIEVFDPVDDAADSLQPVAAPFTEVRIGHVTPDGLVGLDIVLPQ